MQLQACSVEEKEEIAFGINEWVVDLVGKHLSKGVQHNNVMWSGQKSINGIGELGLLRTENKVSAVSLTVQFLDFSLFKNKK